MSTPIATSLVPLLLLFLGKLHCGPVIQIRLASAAIELVQNDLNSFILSRRGGYLSPVDMEEPNWTFRHRLTDLHVHDFTAHPVIVQRDSSKNYRHHVQIQQENIHLRLTGKLTFAAESSLPRLTCNIEARHASVKLTLIDNFTLNCRPEVKGLVITLPRAAAHRPYQATKVFLQQKMTEELKKLLCLGWADILRNYTREKFRSNVTSVPDRFYGHYGIEVGMSQVPHMIGSELILPVSANLLDQHARVKVLSSHKLNNFTISQQPEISRTFHLIVTTDLLKELLKMIYDNGWTQFYITADMIDDPIVAASLGLGCGNLDCIGGLLPPEVVERHLQSQIEFRLKSTTVPLASISKRNGLHIWLNGSIDVYSRHPNGSAEFLFSFTTELKYNCSPRLQHWKLRAQMHLVTHKTTLRQTGRWMPTKESLTQSFADGLVNGLSEAFFEPKINEIADEGLPLPLQLPKGFELTKPLVVYRDGFFLLSANLTLSQKK